MVLWKTKFEKLSLVIVTGAIITLLLLIFRIFFLGVLGIGILSFLIILWRRSLFEELIISFLKEQGGYSSYNKLSKAYSKSAIARLEKRAIVQVKDNVVELLDKNCVCAFDKFNRR